MTNPPDPLEELRQRARAFWDLALAVAKGKPTKAQLTELLDTACAHYSRGKKQEILAEVLAGKVTGWGVRRAAQLAGVTAPDAGEASPAAQEQWQECDAMLLAVEIVEGFRELGQPQPVQVGRATPRDPKPRDMAVLAKKLNVPTKDGRRYCSVESICRQVLAAPSYLAHATVYQEFLARYWDQGEEGSDKATAGPRAADATTTRGTPAGSRKATAGPRAADATTPGGRPGSREARQSPWRAPGESRPRPSKRAAQEAVTDAHDDQQTLRLVTALPLVVTDHLEPTWTPRGLPAVEAEQGDLDARSPGAPKCQLCRRHVAAIECHDVEVSGKLHKRFSICYRCEDGFLGQFEDEDDEPIMELIDEQLVEWALGRMSEAVGER